ncbi:Iron transport multicopper oxidase fetC [Exophiala dermatitidis]
MRVPLLWSFFTISLFNILQWTNAKTVTYDFNITWVPSNPDGLFTRPTIGINGQWPPPTINADLGDTIVVNVLNSLGNQSTSLHFHGLYMNGTTHMDGPAQVSQCSVSPGASFTYTFKAEQVGTYWYHSHTKAQYPDGLRGPLIIHDPSNPYKGQFDEELVLTVSDWYHQQMTELIPKYVGGGMMTMEPVPDANLLNDTHNMQVSVQPGKTYLVRMINMGAFAGQHVWIEGHTMTIVEIDGIYTQPTETEMIYLASAQRCSFLLTTKAESSKNYPIVASLDRSLFMMAGAVNSEVTGWLVYDHSLPLPTPASVSTYHPIDDMTIKPYDEMSLLPKPDKVISLSLSMSHSGDFRYTFNGNGYRHPEVPSLYTALTSGDLATNPDVYGKSTNAFVLEHNQVVEIEIYNRHMTNHPFHLHGHHFQAVWRSPPGGGAYDASRLSDADFHQTPIRRDTIVLPAGSGAVLRFRADNPGVWLFHCHMEWHAETGLVATMVEAPLELQRQRQGQHLPADHMQACAAAGTPVSMNVTAESLDAQAEEEKTVQEQLVGLTSSTIVSLAAGFVFVMTGVVGLLLWLRRRAWKLQDVRYTPVQTSLEDL